MNGHRVPLSAVSAEAGRRCYSGTPPQVTVADSGQTTIRLPSPFLGLTTHAAAHDGYELEVHLRRANERLGVCVLLLASVFKRGLCGQTMSGVYRYICMSEYLGDVC
jgi:hypothetical protein